MQTPTAVTKSTDRQAAEKTTGTRDPTRPPRRSKNGCQRCRERKRKCDESHPICNACLERGTVCEWQRTEQSRKYTRRRQPRYNKQLAVPQQMTPLTTIFVTPIEPTVQDLVSHFETNSPLWLTLGGHEKRNAWLHLVMPSISRSPEVLNCVLAVAAGDLNKFRPASSDLGNLSSAFYGQAVRAVRNAISGGSGQRDSRVASLAHLSRPCSSSSFVCPPPFGPAETDDLLLAVILLCVHEIVNFTNSDRVIPHIRAAAALCRDRSFSVAPDSRGRALLFEIFCYIFTLTAFSHGHSLEFPVALPVFQSPFLRVCQRQGILVGRSLPVFLVILRVSMITKDAIFPLLYPPIKAELRDIEAQLTTWQIKQPLKERASITDEILTTELYRIACLINVKRILGSEQQQQGPSIQELLAEFVAVLNMLSAASPANGVLCWPLVVAGLSAVIATHRSIILGRLRKIYQIWRTDIVNRSSNFLSQIWRENKKAESLQSLSADVSPTTRAVSTHLILEFPTIFV